MNKTFKIKTIENYNNKNAHAGGQHTVKVPVTVYTNKCRILYD